MVLKVDFSVHYAEYFYFAGFVRHDVFEAFTVSVAFCLCFLYDSYAFTYWNLEVMFDSFDWAALKNVVW